MRTALWNLVFITESTVHVLTALMHQRSHGTIRELCSITENGIPGYLPDLMSVSRVERSGCFYQPHSKRGCVLGYFG